MRKRKTKKRGDSRKKEKRVFSGKGIGKM